MSEKEFKIEETSAEKLVEVTGEEKKYLILEWMKQHPFKTAIAVFTGSFIFIMAGYGIYKMISGKLYKVVDSEEETEDFEDKTSEEENV